MQLITNSHISRDNNTQHPILFLLLTGLLFLFSCNQTGTRQEMVEAGFNVDQALLGSDPLTDKDLSFKMQYPAGWEVFKPDFTTQLAKQILVGEYSAARIVKGFMNPGDSSMLIVLDVSRVDSTYFSDLKKNYEEALNPDNIWINVQMETFTHHCFIVDQYVLQNERLVQFRLQCREKDSPSRPPRLEIYYFLNRLMINENIKSIESSIGTLNCIN